MASLKCSVCGEPAHYVLPMIDGGAGHHEQQQVMFCAAHNPVPSIRAAEKAAGR